MPAPVPRLRVHSVMLGTRDVDAAVRFYTERLGFALQSRFGDFAFVEANGTVLTLSADLSKARPLGPTAVEIVLATEHVRESYAALRAAGVVFLSEPHLIDGSNEVANFEDPDGHDLSLYGPP